MKYTENYNLKKPDVEDFYNIEDFNNNADIIDKTLNNKVDKVEGEGLSTNDYTTTEKTKLSGIETGANKYTHPDAHPASMITESAEKKFVSDTEKAAWNAKETPAGAQAKANIAESNAKTYTDTHEAKAAPHSGHETPAGAQAKVDALQSEIEDGTVVAVNSFGNFYNAYDAPGLGESQFQKRKMVDSDEDTWLTIGPPEFAGIQKWYALNNVPVGAKGILMNVCVEAKGPLGGYGGVRIRKQGFSTTPSPCCEVDTFDETLTFVNRSYNLISVPLVNRKFEFQWFFHDLVASGEVRFSLIGWYV